ncbi:TIGR03643 family protein [Dyadobacter sandarakinus]|uniref:TIGR03643 family protein n=1 Tax=Dyadobacter sandarakinus TaxID=2747268 RepID=A0ABX7I1W9_9BACT|nr:TIGR03643 family protein [Dyadobacter sandarakinus]QRR00039.1 TIGR03643 family protein [Dyadobacter sandarakinus]
MQEKEKELKPDEVDRIVEMAWEDRTPFEAISAQFLISEQQVIAIMRTEMQPSSFRMWRKRVQGRATKHMKLSEHKDARFKSDMQRQISQNKISKRT